MRIDPDVEALLKLLAAVPQLQTMSPVEARDNLAEMSRATPPGPPVASVEDRTIETSGGPLAVRIYKPVADPLGIMLWCHGGGWTLGDLDSQDAPLRSVAVRTEMCIVSVDYRLAPEHQFPNALDDVWAGLVWVDDVRDTLAKPGAPLIVGGDSAGGNLAAVLAILARDAGGPQLAGQLLLYPVIDADFETPSYHENGEGYFLTRDLMRWFWDNYLPDPEQRRDFRASPLRASSLAGLPPTLIQTAGFDPLRDEGEAYARRLEEAGTAVTLRRYEGLIHGHFGMGKIPAAGAAIEDAACWIDGILAA